MPTNESDELKKVRLSAQLLTDVLRATEGPVTVPRDVLNRLEAALWSAYALACEAEALRERLDGQEATR